MFLALVYFKNPFSFNCKIKRVLYCFETVFKIKKNNSYSVRLSKYLKINQKLLLYIYKCHDAYGHRSNTQSLNSFTAQQLITKNYHLLCMVQFTDSTKHIALRSIAQCLLLNQPGLK